MTQPEHPGPGRTGLLAVAFLALLRPAASAADWTQYRGPNHDAISSERIQTQWTGNVTNPVWRVHLTNGLTSLTISGGRVFTQVGSDFVEEPPYLLARRESCVALDAATGTILWSTETEASANPLFPNLGVGFTDDGPRSTPVVYGDSVYVLSSYLKLYRLDAVNGSIIWSTNLAAGFSGSVIPWQNAASPVIEDGRIFVNANSSTASLMAFSTTNGTLLWRSQNDSMTQSTPALATINSVRQVIFATQRSLVALNPLNGALIWRTNHPFSYSTSIGSSPVVGSNYVFLTANYSMSGFAVQIVSTNGAEVPVPRWNNSLHRSHWSTPVYFQGALYGSFYPDSANAELRCVDMATGVARWAAAGFGRGGILLVGTNLVVSTERGDLVLVAAVTNAFTELARFRAIPGYLDSGNKCWNALALSDGQVYVRSTAYAARFDFSVPEVPDLKLDPPTMAFQVKGGFTIRTTNGSPIASQRLAGLEVCATTNLTLPPAQWPKLNPPWLLSNGILHVAGLDVAPPRQFFLVREANPNTSWPGLRLDIPRMAPQALVQLAVRSVAGTALDSNRLTAMELRATTNLGLPREAWPRLPAAWYWSNGVITVNAVASPAPQTFFIVAEPN